MSIQHGTEWGPSKNYHRCNVRDKTGHDEWKVCTEKTLIVSTCSVGPLNAVGYRPMTLYGILVNPALSLDFIVHLFTKWLNLLLIGSWK